MICLLLLPLLLAPAVYRWWDCRRLRWLTGDAAIAEHWLAHTARSTRVTVACAVLVLVTCPGWALASLPLLLFLAPAGDYPARRTVFGETWSLAGYLTWSIRLFVAVLGFWVLLGLSPYLIGLAGAHGIAVAVVLAAVLVAWDRWYPRVLLRIVGARTLDPQTISPELARGLDRVTSASLRFTNLCDRSTGLWLSHSASPSLGVTTETILDGQAYFGSSLRPAFRLSKLRTALKTRK